MENVKHIHRENSVIDPHIPIPQLQQSLVWANLISFIPQCPSSAPTPVELTQIPGRIPSHLCISVSISLLNITVIPLLHLKINNNSLIFSHTWSVFKFLWLSHQFFPVCLLESGSSFDPYIAVGWYTSSSCTLKTVCQFMSCGCSQSVIPSLSSPSFEKIFSGCMNVTILLL